MNTTDLIAHVAADTDLSKAQIKRVLNSIVEVTARALQKHENVKINDLGTFRPKHRAARTGTNPATGRKMKIAARWTVTCTVSKTLKDQV